MKRTRTMYLALFLVDIVTFVSIWTCGVVLVEHYITETPWVMFCGVLTYMVSSKITPMVVRWMARGTRQGDKYYE